MIYVKMVHMGRHKEVVVSDDQLAKYLDQPGVQVIAIRDIGKDGKAPKNLENPGVAIEMRMDSMSVMINLALDTKDEGWFHELMEEKASFMGEMGIIW